MSNAGPPTPPSRWTRWHTVGLLVTCGLLFLVAIRQAEGPFPWSIPLPGFLASLGKVPAFSSWLFDLLLVTTLVGIVSHGLKGAYTGVLIDDRERMSLSRLQAAVWTILIVSALLAAGMANIAFGRSDPLAINIPGEVWALVGISTVALVGAPSILNNKRMNPPPPAVTTQPALSPMGVQLPVPSWRDRLQAQGIDTTRMSVQGSVIVRDDPSAAAWGDLFRGDEASNGASIDLAKLQTFLITLVLFLTYACALGKLFLDADRKAPTPGPGIVADRKIDKFPLIDTSLVALLGISNVGFLASQAMPRPGTPT